MVPSVGRIVLYRLTAAEAEQVNKRRQDARASGIARTDSGAVVHFGNTVREGDALPMVVCRVWGSTATSGVNGQVFLDGNDTLWTTSRVQGYDSGQWSDPREQPVAESTTSESL